MHDCAGITRTARHLLKARPAGDLQLSQLRRRRPATSAQQSTPALDAGAVVSAIGLFVACLLQAPGRIATDTKLDLAVDPGAFLGRTLHLIDPQAAFGEIPNQAAGYLFPMGPFFAGGHALGVPMWLVQRTWLGLVLVVAMLGTRLVARRLGIGSSATQTLAGLAYALAPAVLGVVGTQSGGVLPTALAPWALLPLIGEIRSPRRAAALSGIAVLCMGGINATSTGAALVVPFLWLITRRTPARWRLLGWWLLTVTLATLWWVVALLLQTRYGLKFTAYTETASLITSKGSLTETVRGTSYWLGYLFTRGPWLAGAWDLVHAQLAIVGTVVVAATGLAGLTRRELPERRFLVTSALVGIVAIAIGYAGPLSGPFSHIARDLLDGPLAPVRNVTKLDPLVRLPLALGFAHAAHRFAHSRAGKRRSARVALAGTAVATVVVITAGAVPIARGHVTTPGAFREIPGYWQAAGHWLDTHDDGRRVLVVPAASFAEYTWGRPLEEPLQTVSDVSWAVRDLIPLGSIGATRLLDLVERRIAEGRVDAPLVDVLARSGIRHLVVRNDLDLPRTGAPSPGRVRAALAATSSLRRVATFGPFVPPGMTSDHLLATPPGPLHAVEVYELVAPSSRVDAYPSADAWTLSGGPDGLVGLASSDQLAGRATVLAGDPEGGAAPDPVAWTDALRRRDVAYGAVRNNYSYGLTGHELSPNSRRVPHDRLVVHGREHLALADQQGVFSLRSSSYGALGRRQPEYQPFAAFDGDPTTAWVAAPRLVDVKPTLDLHFATPRNVNDGTVQLLFDQVPRSSADRILVRTDRGKRITNLEPTSAPQAIAVPPGPTRRLRVIITKLGGNRFGPSGPGISELRIPGIDIERVVALPADGRDRDASIFLDRLRFDPYEITRRDEEGSLRRAITLAKSTTFTATGTAVPVPGVDLDALLTPPDAGLRASATSTWNDLPAFAPRHAVDGTNAYAWVAQPKDAAPALSLSWDGPRRLDRVTVRTAQHPVQAPTRLRIESPAGTRDVRVQPGRTVTFEPLETDTVRVELIAPNRVALDTSKGRGVTARPYGLAEVRFPALDDLVPPVTDPNPIDVPCGSGPSLTVDGRPVATAVRTNTRQAAALRAGRLVVCGALTLDAGRHVIEGRAAGAFSIGSLNLTSRQNTSATASDRDIRIKHWGVATRAVELAPGPRAYVALTENFNAGWRATLAGKTLPAVRLDGWRQAFIAPAGRGGTVDIEFVPDRWYRIGLIAGLLAALALLALAFVPSRRTRVRLATPPARPWPRLIVGLLAFSAVLAVTGPVALVVPLLLFLPDREDSLPTVAWWSFILAGVVVLSAAGIIDGSDAGTFSGAAQVLAGVAVAALAVSLVERKPAP